jgi:TonB family protein
MRACGILICLMTFGLACSAEQPLPSGTPRKDILVYAPKPPYPYELRAQHRGGSGVFVFEVETDSGLVLSVTVEKSTGIPELDESTVNTLRQWRFKPHRAAKKVKIPITFTMAGAERKHR